MKSVGVIFGGPSPEHDVSILTGLQAARELASTVAAGGSVTAVYWTKSGGFFSVPPTCEASDFRSGLPSSASPLRLVAGAGFVARASLARDKAVELEAVVNCCHGGPGEDGTLQGLLDSAGILHAGPSVAGAALGMDKLAFGALVTALGLPALPRALLTVSTPIGFAGPYIVKPRFGGSSLGIDVVADAATARARLSANPLLASGAVVEPHRPDLFDLNVAIRTFPSLELSAIEKPIRSPDRSEIFSYYDKYVPGEGMVAAPRELPAKIEPLLEKQLREAATTVAQACMVRGIARMDFLSDGSALYLNEINTIPGSLARHLWIEPKIPFGELLVSLLDEAAARPSAVYSTSGADGSVLSTAGSIAAKLG